MHDSRKNLRSRLLNERRTLPSDTQRAAAATVCEIVSELLANRRPGTVAGYLSHGGELDPEPALERLIELGWNVALPVCGADASMVFCPWSPGDALRPNRYGIGEPTGEPVDESLIDVVLVPGVGFDRTGARIGHGVGYYDRFFARLAAAEQHPLRLALAHDLQLVTLPEPEDWDVPMHIIATPSEVITVDFRPTEHR
jgi:5-formyltetrahydrofolate cyclo-ligase